jgi:glycosyltransferase involved in cell wall biosynthesis
MNSICLTTFNGERFIKEQIESVLPQLALNDEIIVSDDGSTDNTINIIKNFCDERIKITEHAPLGNVIKNVEHALSRAKGDYIFLCDQDDVWMPDKIEVTLKNLQDCDLVMSDCLIVDELGKLLHPSFFALRKVKPGFTRNLWKNAYTGCCMAFKKRLLADILPFPLDVPMHDWWIGLIAEKMGKVKFLEQKLVKYRRHNANISFEINKSKLSFYEKMFVRYRMLKLVNNRMRNLKKTNSDLDLP